MDAETKQGLEAPAARPSTISKHTPAPWAQSRWGNHAFEIQGGGHSIAIVGRVQAKRLEYLAGQRSKAAKNGEPAHQAEQEAQRIEAYDLLPDAKLIAAAPAFADAAWDARVAEWKHTRGCATGECWCYRLGAALRAAGRLDEASGNAP